MNSVEELITISINTQKGICIVNGVDVSRDASYLKLEFENGEWSLQITTERFFSSVCKKGVLQVDADTVLLNSK